jgi:hypothetical protein
VNIQFSKNLIADFCHRWDVTEFALFGSVIGEGFQPNSDVDVLISFKPDAQWSLFDLVTMQYELKGIFGRNVDLVELEGLTNPFRRHAILNSKEVIYEATGA